jgi:hypothetical protein
MQILRKMPTGVFTGLESSVCHISWRHRMVAFARAPAQGRHRKVAIGR